MKYLSTFSGIEAASVAWEPLGWTPAGFSEIDPFASSVLAHRFPGVTNYGDITKHESWGLEPGAVDLLVGGSPCQAFSVAGLRRGLDDPRGQLTLVYLQLAARLRPRWIVWENVPGVLSADGGRAFGAFLGGLEELGYGWAYRILDARHFGVPQRRRRVFLVARSSGDWKSAAKVLLEPEGLRGNPAEGESSRQGSPRGASDRAREGGQWWDGGDVASTITRKGCDQRMPDKDNFLAVLDSVGTLDCSCGGDKLQVQHAVSGHLIPIVGDTMATIDTKAGGAGFCNQSVDNGHFIPMVGHTMGTVHTKFGTAGFSNGQFIPMVESQFAQYRAEDVGGTLRRKGGTCGDGSETIVIERSAFNQGVNAQYQSFIGESDSVPTVIARGPHAVAIQGNLIGRDAGGPQGVGCSTEDTMYTLTRGDVHGVAIPIDGRNALRDPEKFDEVNRQGVGIGEPGDPAHTVTTACVHAVAIPIQDGRGMEKGQNGFGVGADADPAYTLDTTGAQSVCIGLNSEMNAVNDGIGTLRRGGQGGIQEVVAFSSNMSAPDVREDGCSPCLKLGGHGGSNPPAIAFKPGQSAAARSDGVSFDCAPTLEAGGGGNNKPAVCAPIAFTCSEQSNSFAWERPVYPTLTSQVPNDTSNIQHGIRDAMVVRRLLPVECERLQGFPDGWTAVPHKGKPAADGPRYKALGNSMAVPCMRWIGERIKALEEGRL